MWNRTLSASEISQLYKTNLKQTNETDWEFYANESGLAETTYTYQIFAKDISGEWFNSALRSFMIKWTVASAATEEISSGSRSFNPSNKTLESGYNASIKENDKINFKFDDEKKTILILKVSLNEIKFSIDGKNYSVQENETIKIDLNSDGYYDLQIFARDIYSTKYAKLEVKLINEKIPAEEKSSAEETQVENVPAEKKTNYKWIIAGIAILILAVGLKIFTDRKFEKKFGKKWK